MQVTSVLPCTRNVHTRLSFSTAHSTTTIHVPSYTTISRSQWFAYQIATHSSDAGGNARLLLFFFRLLTTASRTEARGNVCTVRCMVFICKMLHKPANPFQILSDNLPLDYLKHVSTGLQSNVITHWLLLLHACLLHAWVQPLTLSMFSNASRTAVSASELLILR